MLPTPSAFHATRTGLRPKDDDTRYRYQWNEEKERKPYCTVCVIQNHGL